MKIGISGESLKLYSFEEMQNTSGIFKAHDQNSYFIGGVRNRNSEKVAMFLDSRGNLVEASIAVWNSRTFIKSDIKIILEN